MSKQFLLILVFFCGSSCIANAADPAPDYSKQVAPIFKKYCVGCHNGTDTEGDFNLETFADLQLGGANGAAILPGEAKASRLIRMLTGQLKPQMPPQGKPAPTAAEIEILSLWIVGGAKGPEGAEPDRTVLLTPTLPKAKSGRKAVTAIAVSPKDKSLAVGRFGTVEIRSANGGEVIRTFGDHPGKVNSLAFSKDGSQLIVGTGITGLYGEVRIWNVADGSLVKKIRGHRDTLYAAALSPDEKLIATGSYDREIRIWDAANGEHLRTLKGHNHAIYDVAFSPDGTVLASASGDHTVKVWSVATGERLDTLSQPLKEQYAVTFSPDGKSILAGGVDNRIRVWDFVSKDTPRINPIRYARFAHEGAILKLAFTADGKTLVSTAEDGGVKLWETGTYSEFHVYPLQPDVTAALAFVPGSRQLALGRMDGSVEVVRVPELAVTATEPVETVVSTVATATEMSRVAETEPNDLPENATAISLPGTAAGVIQSRDEAQTDVDLYRFDAKAGQTWIFEIKAARDGSPLDSKIEVLHADGSPVLRLLLQAVRDSYIDFRGMDSNDRAVRLHNWEEMELNQYLYLSGEVCKLFLAPRGPDSGFDVYPHTGSRYSYFDTSPITHAIHEPAFIVEPHPPGTKLIPSGLPVFPLYYQNDDDGFRKLGSDSRLTFTAPEDGTYLVRVTDIRGFSGENFKYELTVRPPKPDFQVTLTDANPTVNLGSGKGFTFNVNRDDGFDGEIRIDIDNVPAGFAVSTPIIVEAGHNTATATLIALASATAPAPEQAKGTVITATATINGHEVTKTIDNLGEIKLGEKPKVRVSLTATGEPPPSLDEAAIPELVIAPGETITATLRVDRDGFDDRIRFNAQNLPHGVIVDNIGLSGILIPEKQTERTIYLSAARWVADSNRLIYLETQVEGKQTTWPVMLRVRKPEAVAAQP